MVGARPTLVTLVSFVVNILDKINRPSRLRRAILFDLSVCQLAKLRPTICSIVIVIIIVIIGEVQTVIHSGGIIAHFHFGFTILKTKLCLKT